MTKMDQTIVLLVFCSISSTMVSATVYQVGSPISISCEKDGKDGREYDPTFNVKPSEASGFTTLFTGKSPRPETDINRWSVEEAGNQFTYKLDSAILEDAGDYRCDNINDVDYQVTMIGNDVVCPAGGTQYRDQIQEQCKLAKAGPDGIALKWSNQDGISLESVKETLKSTISASLELSVHPDLNGAIFTCSLDLKGFEDLKCNHGPVEILYDVSAAGDIIETVAGSQATVLLIGNPSPESGKISVIAAEDLTLKTDKKVMKDGTVEVSIELMPANGYSKDQISVNVSYDSAIVKFLEFDLHPSPAPEPESGNAGTIAGVVVALVLIIICAILLIILWKKNILFAAKEAEEDKLDEAEKGLQISDGEEKPAEADDIKVEQAEEETKLVTAVEDNAEESEEKEAIKETNSVEGLDDQPPTSKPLETAT